MSSSTLFEPKEKIADLNYRLNNGLDVYAHYMAQMGYDFRPYKKFKSPFQPTERHPSFSVYKHQATQIYWHSDFAREKAGNHWTFVQRLFGITNFWDAVAKVKQDILGEVGGVSNQIFIRQTYVGKYGGEKEKGSVQLDTDPRPWTTFDELYWSQFNASELVGDPINTIEELEMLHLQAAASFHMKTSEKEFTKIATWDDPMYDVYFPQADETVRHKMYRPLTKDKKFKFGPSNVDAEKDLFAFHLVPGKCKNLFITAGQKDTFAFRCLTGRQLPCFPLNSENARMPEWLPSFLSLIAENVYTIMNNDVSKIHPQSGKMINTGKDATNYLKKDFGYQPAQQPLFDYQVNDIAELVHGLKAIPEGPEHLLKIRDYYLNL